MKKTVAVSLLVLLGAGLAGCTQAREANTTLQNETGSGTKLTAGLLEIEALTVVASEDGATGAVSGVLVNNGTEGDSLARLTIDGTAAALTPASVAVPPGQSVKIGTGAEASAQVALSAAAGTYVEVTMDFANSGRVTGEVLVVPPVSFYAPAAPASPAAPEVPAEPATAAPAATTAPEVVAE